MTSRRSDDDAFSRSTTSSSNNSSTPSKVLSDKLDQLDRTWTQHKATSPIPIVRRRNMNHNSTTTAAPTPGQPPSENNAAAASATINTNNINITRCSDHESVGESSSGSVSTLSSVASSEEPGLQSQSQSMSVFDRLYRQGIQSPRRQQKERQRQRHQSSSRKKNRLGAYQRHAVPTSATDTAPVSIATTNLEKEHTGDEDDDVNSNDKLIDTTVTPRRRTTRPLSSSSFLSVPSEDTEEEEEYSATFHRLYRNEKRDEKLWKKPTPFSPIPISKQQQGPRNTTPAGISATPVPFERVASTTFDQDLEAIVELGRQIGSHRDDNVRHNTNETSTFNNMLTLILGDENDDSTNNPMISPTILTATSVSSAADTTTPSSTTLDDDVHALELLGKELDEMEATNNRSQGQTPERVRDPSAVIPSSRNRKQQISENERAEISSSHTRHTDTTADDTYGFFTLDQSSRSYFFAERVDRLSVPYRRRTRGRGAGENGDDDDDENYGQRPSNLSLSSSLSQQDEPLLTPRRLRTSACVSIQTSWRMHLSELDLTARMLSTWRTNVSVVGTYRQAPRLVRRAALVDAVKIVPCWWILEGFHAERNWVSVAWENEVEIGKTKVLVQVTCDAKAPSVLEGVWTERKLAILLVKATLMRSFRGECAAGTISRWYRRHRGKLNNSALLIQHLSRVRERRIENFTCAEVEDETAIQNPDAMQSPSEQLVGQDVHEIRTSISTEDAAAVTIQNWFRVLVLKDALKRVPSTANQLKSVLNPTTKPSTVSLPTTDIDIKIIQDVLRHSSIGQRLTAWIEDPDADLVSRRAASLAIQNIVRAYLKGLVIYRRKRKAKQIQAWVRGFLARRRIDELHYAAVIIQFAWSNHRYLDYRKKHAVVIQKFWRRISYQQQYRMSLFCVILIQATWRCSLAQRSLHSSISAATKIQSAWRGYCERRRYLSTRSAVISVQDLFRKHLVLQQYRRDMYSATVLQAWWRMKKSRNLLLDYVSATIIMQSIVRRDIQFRRFQRIRASAIALQSGWRMTLDRESFVQSVHSAVVLQQNWRAYYARMKYISKYDALIRLQSTWRAAKARSLYQSSIQSIVFVQACLRRSMAQRGFLEQQISAVIIQRIWRGSLGRKEADWLRLQIIDSRATSIQSWWRSISIQRKYNSTLEKIIKVQAVIRCSLARRYFEDLLLRQMYWEAATSIQSQWRSLECRQKLARAISSTITIQATVRGVLARRIYSNMLLSRRRLESDSARILQSVWRRRQVRCSYMQLLSSVVKVQASFRVFLSKNARLRIKAVKLSFAATIIQTRWRAAMCRDQYLISRNAAIVIQARARTLLATQIYQMLVFEEQKRKEWEASLLQMYHSGAIKLQSTWRMHNGRRLYLNRLSSAILIQTIARHFLSRHKLDAHRCFLIRRDEVRDSQKEADLDMSAILIQSQWRGATARSLYESARVACIIIQCSCRRAIATKERKNLELLVLDTSASIIQSRFRGLRSRKEYQSIITSRAEMEEKAIVIQSLARRSLLRNRRILLLSRQSDRMKHVEENEKSDLETQRSTAATLIQAYWRRTTLLDRFTEIRISAILIQSVFRRHMCKTRSTESIVENHAAVVIQRSVRCRTAVEQYRTTRVYIVMIQSLWRGMLTRSQWRFIRYLAMERNSMNSAAREIQVAFVLWKMDNAVWEMKSLAVLLKRGVRGQLVRSAVFFALKHINSSIFPTIVNAYDRVVLVNHGVEPILAWNRALSQARLSACVVIQSYVRRMIVRNQVRSSYGIAFETSFIEPDPSEDERISAVLIQRSFRSWIQLRHESCTKIQRIVKGWMARQSFYLRLGQYRLMLQLSAATKIQRIVRGWMARQTFYLRLGQHRFLLQLSAATKIQAVWKMFIARKIRIEYTCAVIQIQSIVRGHRSRLLFGTFRRAVVFLQEAFRERKVRLEQQEAAIISFSAAVRIQAFVRGVSARFLVSDKRRRLIAQSETIRDKLIMRANRLGAQDVEDLLERKAYPSGACIGRLVDRVHSAIEVSDSEQTQLKNMASARPSATKIPVPERRHGRAGISRSVIITPVRSNKKDLQSIPPQSDDPVHLQVPSLAPRNRLVAQAKKLTQDARKNVRQNDQKSVMQHTPTKTRSNQQSIPLPSDETGDVDTSMPSFDATSPISKTETSGWDWTDS
mmetsp:Transcript_59658/g.146290  ORF Transcript_59658/g.146290 Transcript_59658/m.146290 type:complete len:2161 (+) Transcript_59658:331-6813(+)